MPRLSTTIPALVFALGAGPMTLAQTAEGETGETARPEAPLERGDTAPAANAERELEIIDVRKIIANVALPENVNIRDLNNGMVCERQRPTGSRIAREFCYTREQHETRRRAQDQLMRDDFEQMRQREMDRNLAQQAARAEALQNMRRSGF